MLEMFNIIVFVVSCLLYAFEDSLSIYAWENPSDRVLTSPGNHGKSQKFDAWKNQGI